MQPHPPDAAAPLSYVRRSVCVGPTLPAPLLDDPRSAYSPVLCWPSGGTKGELASRHAAAQNRTAQTGTNRQVPDWTIR
jgi:hypothetical protein